MMTRKLALTVMLAALLSCICPAAALAQGIPAQNPDSPPPPAEPAAPRPAAAGAGRAAQPAATSPAKASGLWLETKLRSGAALGVGGIGGVSVQHLPGILVGYKADKLVIALGIALLVGNEEQDEADYEFTATGGVVGPVIQYEFANKGPLSAYGQGGLGFRFSTSEEEEQGDTTETGGFGFSLNLAGGMRYYFHPSFALGAELGLDLSVLWFETERTGDPDQEYQYIETALYGALTAAVVW